MSNLKNVLKAGFLVTASLLTVGCDTDNKAINPTPAPTPTPTIPSTVTTALPDMGNVITALKSSAGGGLGLIQLKDFTTDANISDVFKALFTDLTSTGQAASNVTDKSLISLTNVKLVSDKVLEFKADVSGTTAGALMIDGLLNGKDGRHVAKSTLTGGLTTGAFMMNNGVMYSGSSAASTLTTSFAAVGIDAAVGYPFARQDSTGKEIVFGTDVHSLPSLALAVTSTGKTVPSPAKTSKATQSKGVTKDALKTTATKTAVINTSKTPVKTAPAKKSGAGDLTLSVTGINASSILNANQLDAAGLHVYGTHGAADIAGRVSHLSSAMAVVTSVNTEQPELEIPAISGVETTATEKTSKAKSHASTLALAAAAKANKAGSAAKTPAKAADKIVDKSNKTATTPAVKQTLVKKTGSNDHHFLFSLKDGNYAEVGNWAVNADSEYQVIAHHSMVVHDLDLKANLGIRVFAEGHTLEKLDGTKGGEWTKLLTTGDKVENGQAMMQILADHDHAIHESELVEEAGSNITPYKHFDSHTPFPLWVVGKVTQPTTTANSFSLVGVDLAENVNLDAGIYAMPLAKIFSAGGLENRANAASEKITLSSGAEIDGWKIMSNGYNDYVLFVQVKSASSLALGSDVIGRTVMGSAAQNGRSVLSSTLNNVVERLNPTNLAAVSFANVSTARINQAAQVASLARGVSGVTAETLGAVEQYAVSFNHNGTQVGLTYNIDGGNAFAGSKGTSSFGMNVASDVLGLKAIVSADASVDAAKNAYTSASHASYNAGVTFAKAYSLGGLSVVPMAGFGVASNAINGYSAVVPMAAGSLGLCLNDVSFSSATFHAGVNVALDEFVASTAGVNASVAFGVAGYLAATADATLSTSEGKSADLKVGGNAVTPYAQFNLGFATGEKVNAMISSGAAAVSFGIDR